MLSNGLGSHRKIMRSKSKAWDFGLATTPSPKTYNRSLIKITIKNAVSQLRTLQQKLCSDGQCPYTHRGMRLSWQFANNVNRSYSEYALNFTS